MLIQLNAEVWMGILNWLLKHRKEMAEKFSQFGDVEFSQLTQTWLHQWTRNVTLGELNINEGFKNQLTMLNRNQMPANIADFSTIKIRYFDAEALQFFRQIQRFLAKVNFFVDGETSDHSKHSITILRQLLPLINGIEVLCLNFGNSEILAFFKAEFPAQFYDARFLEVDFNLPYQGELQDYLLWISTPKNDGLAKTLYLFATWIKSETVLQKIRQHFLDPLIPPVCYFVWIWAEDVEMWLWSEGASSTIQNAKGEQLVVRKYEENDRLLLIARCSSDVGVGEEWFAQKRKEFVDYRCEQKRRIDIDLPETGQSENDSSDSGSEDSDDSSMDASTNSSGTDEDESNDGDDDMDGSNGDPEIGPIVEEASTSGNVEETDQGPENIGKGSSNRYPPRARKPPTRYVPY